ncbi:PREDICTED: heterodimeric geranylgeranyl pyrophosphate synthase small subunit, chloroplastic-like [Nelumbo nucifera]|uniref:Heterodimeric geranylgeranyl pyrophosphate synthase small subunit, chloroplastic-like n=1 Tax=Nelumbo nucifera TaxID=4432 RepID=A0A1U8B5A0_NELNU|nr:PREDICTED: heterodimeric geranylgeranyl pyrophosphate synthase small subunit, chloroplastic-like [Nelumbo nucifera]
MAAPPHFTGSLGYPPSSPSPRSHLHCLSPCNRAIKVSMSQNQSYWTCVTQKIEDQLKQLIPVRPPLLVYEPMHHLVFTARRTMAPALCVATCELVGGQQPISPNQALVVASALHLVQAALFTHEQLPLTDRPIPSNPETLTHHHAFAAGVELLTGDGILSFVYELLGRSDDPAGGNSERLLRVIIEIARAMGSEGMVDGQYRKMLCSVLGSEELCDVGWVDHVCEKKEGRLYACGAACGAILGGGSEEEIEKLRNYGLYVGKIHGLMLYYHNNRTGGEEKGFTDLVERCTSLALKELEGFNQGMVQTLSSLVRASFWDKC